MSRPKLRMVAGPNGSGKTTLIQYLRDEFSLGHIQNPDEIERQIAASGQFDLGLWEIACDLDVIEQFFAAHPLTAGKAPPIISIQNTVMSIDRENVDGYFVSALCDFMRRQWLITQQSFTVETVMSHPDKPDLLREAHQQGYRTYLYYICTDSHRINEARVAARVSQGGHGVPEGKIAKRYISSLGLLAEAIRHSSRAFLFDNSGKSHRFIAEYEENRLIRAMRDLPSWFVEAMLVER